MKAHPFLLPAGFVGGSGKGRLAVGKKDGAWGIFVYPTQDEETEESAAAANEQFERWRLVKLPTDCEATGWDLVRRAIAEADGA